MDNREKIIALYRYIKELCGLKYRVISDVEKQHWRCYLKDIPNDSEHISIFYRDRVEEETDDDTILLTVKKPDFQRCPEPPTILTQWLEPGWDRFTNALKVKNSLSTMASRDIVDEDRPPEHFGGSEQRVKALKQWNTQRDNWVEKQHIINRTRSFFTQLFEVYTDLERESDTLELMVGNGIIREIGNHSTNHPILLKRVKFQFDARTNIISIHDTDTEPELYTLLLQDMREINHAAVKQLKEELHDNFYHALDRNDSQDFLKILTHKLCSHSRFITDDNDTPDSEDRLTVKWNPVFFARKRIDGTLKTIEEIIVNIENNGKIPGHLVNLVDGGEVEIPEDNYEPPIEEQLATLNGESLPILLSKEANREQLEIAERIEHYNAVLVQGPPGTGKTHTIANLLGHFLAQGKSVLVTSHTRKALTVLKEKVPDEIKDLCVSVLDDTNLDMVRSIDGISEYMSRYTANELKKRVESDNRHRTNIIKQLSDIRKKIYAIRYKEFEPIVYNGNSYSPAKAAAFVNANSTELSYIPGKVKLHHSLPITIEQLKQLYYSNAELSETEELELNHDIPSPDSLQSPAEFSNDLNKAAECTDAIDRVKRELDVQIDIDISSKTLSISNGVVSVQLLQDPSAEELEQLRQYVSTFKSIDGWMIHAAVDGRKGGGYRQRWDMLISAIEDTAVCADAIVTQIVGRTIVIKPEIDSTQLSWHLETALRLFQKKGKLTKLQFLLNKPLKSVLAGISISGLPIASESDCRLVQHYLRLQEKRNQTALLWNELMAKHGTPEFLSLSDEPEHIGLRMIPNIRRYLDWYQNEYAQLLHLVEQAGLNVDTVFCESVLDSELTHTEKMLSTVYKKLPRYIDLANSLITLCGIEDRKTQAIRSLSEGERKQSSICNLLVSAIVSSKPENYERYYQQLSELCAKYVLKTMREEMLALIEPVAPEWADAINNRVGIHGDITCPQTIESAWKWKQFAGIIDSITAEPFEELQRKAGALANDLRLITAKVAAHSAWYHLMLSTERNLDMRQALQGWKLTIKKIGKGTGKNAPALKKHARELMAKCQRSVPAWIMTVNKAMESLNPASNTFDIIIVDEASQSDISALGIVYMAKKIIIVGDDKQVSPMAVGIDIDRMNALRDMYIKDIIPNWHLFDAKTSLYDIAGTTFQPLMLREHFRCLPDIIGYSNKLSYDFKIKPLRGAETSRVSPPIVKFRVDDGRREGRQKINTKEAETIVALMMACIEQEEYEALTFGAISLLGDEQAQKIQQIILQRIDPVVIEQRRILCGNASHFQGDERDVIFLSLVDSNEGDGPLNMAGEGSDQSRKQRYNVAVSRAKDQLWVVHSLDYTRDLKNGDLRRDLLEYADNPKAFAQLTEKIKADAESPFEEAVAKALVASGYHVEQQWKVGAYRIDMVVFYNGSSAAIECDGELFHSGNEKVRADMERQTILERTGWRFIRIRGSEYYSNPDKTMERVKRELKELGILPETVLNEPAEQLTSALINLVKNRAAQILDEWHSQNNDIVTTPNEPIATVAPDQVTLLPQTKVNMEFEQTTIVPSSVAEKPQAKRQGAKDSVRRTKTSYAERTLPSAVSAVGENAQGRTGQRRPISSSKEATLINSLKTAGIGHIDNRAQSGIIWVPLAGVDEQQIENIIGECGLRYSFERRGSKATKNQPAWRIMVD